MKKAIFSKFLFLLLAAQLLTACLHRGINAEDMVSKMIEIQSKESSYINILWYEGSDESYHYFSYVYSMFGTNHYRVTITDLQIPHVFPKTKKSDEWERVGSINEVWVASRRDASGHKWRVEDKGLLISITHGSELAK